MRKLVLTYLLAIAITTPGIAQTLFTYGGNQVSKEEFISIYKKNSINKQPDFSDSALRDYLNLYSLFRMKVAEAEAEKLDTLPSVSRELDNYRKQLARNYFTDEEVTNRLIREAYDRMKEDVRVTHILILCRQGADSTAAYRKIDSIYKAITTQKADFGEMAKQYSEDKDSKDNGGDIGYFTALQTVYPFENVAYTTAVGKVSAPFRTQFGYHILKVIDKRPSVGEIKVAQILIATPKSKGQEGVTEARKRADSIVTALRNGSSFEAMVKKYSNDKFSVDNNGELAAFGAGRMTPAFEKAAFALNKPGDISAPVQSDYGFHIIKLIKKYPLKPYDSLQPQLKRKVENDYRAQVARDIFFEKVKQKNGFKEFPANLAALIQKFNKIPDTGAEGNSFKEEDFRNMREPLFMLGNNKYLQSDFVSFMNTMTRGKIMGPRGAVVNDLYKVYVTNVVNDFEEHKLVEENPDFKNLMSEYRSGILLFELMDRNVWGKASKDSAGLQAFYETRKGKYQWEPGFRGAVYKFKDEESMKKGLKLISANTKDEEILKAVNTQANPDAVSISHNFYEFSRFTDVPKADIKKDQPSKPVKKDGVYIVVKATEVYDTPSNKTLDEARGYVVAEYQDYLEKKWNEHMRQKFPFKVDEAVYNSMVKK